MIKRMIVGFLQENCYVMDDANGHCLIVDPGDDAKKIKRYIDEHELKVEAILLTHGHFDHIGAVDPLVQYYECLAYIHPEDEVIIDAYMNHPDYKRYHVQLHSELHDLRTFKSKYFDIEVLHTPGHSPGSSLILEKQSMSMFSGDTVFKGTVGRTDLLLSSPHDMKMSIELIKTLPSEYRVYPGHEDATTLAIEFKENPFF